MAQPKYAWHFRHGHDVPGHGMPVCPYNNGPGPGTPRSTYSDFDVAYFEKAVDCYDL